MDKPKRKTLNERKLDMLKNAHNLSDQIPTKYVSDFWGEFKNFAFKGNVIELAVGVVIGTGFNNLVQSLVTNIIMPPIGKLLGNSAFSELFIDLSGDGYTSLTNAELAGAPVIKYGLFISNMIDFVIMALAVFIVIRYVLRVKKQDAK